MTEQAFDTRLEHLVKEALMEAGEVRLRPIVMTTVAMIFGMFPIAFSHSAGSEWKSGLAFALIGGLTSSMFFTLVLVPVVYYLFSRGSKKITHKVEIEQAPLFAPAEQG